MQKIIILMTILTIASFITPCSAQKKTLKGVSHGKELAYTGDADAGPLEMLRLTVLKDEEEIIDIELDGKHGYYEAKYIKEGERDYKVLTPQDVLMLQDVLLKTYTNENYHQDYKSKKGEKGTEWHLGTKHKNAAFLINGIRVDYKNFAIMNFVINYFNDVFEFTNIDKPFPKGNLKYFRYSHKGSMRPGGPEWTVERMNDGTYKVTYIDDSSKFMGEEIVKKEKECDESLGESLCEIFRKGKIQNYKSEYINPMVMDGSSWNFEVKFDDGTYIRTHGYMDGPRDRSGITNSLKFLEELMDITY